MGDVTKWHPIWRPQHGSVDILTDKVDEIAWIKRAGHSYCYRITEKIVFFPYNQVWSTIVFFFLLFSFVNMRNICCHPSIQTYRNIIRLSAYRVFNGFSFGLYFCKKDVSVFEACGLSDVPPFWCCFASGPILVHERSDIDARAVRYGFGNTSNNGPGN